MKNKLITFALIGIFVLTSLMIFGAEANAADSNSNLTSANTGSLLLSNNLYEGYCSVDLAERNSNLNVRTWEGEVTGKLRHGTRVWVNEYSGEWARVSVKRGRRWVSIGWVDSNYLLC